MPVLPIEELFPALFKLRPAQMLFAETWCGCRASCAWWSPDPWVEHDLDGVHVYECRLCAATFLADDTPRACDTDICEGGHYADVKETP